jgi:hypothetical protein
MLSWAPGASYLRARGSYRVSESVSGKCSMTIAPIKQAEQHVAEGERHTASQREIVVGLKRKRGRGGGAELWTEQVLLQTLELAQQFHIADRDRLRTKLLARE